MDSSYWLPSERNSVNELMQHLRLTRSECERDRIPFAPSYFHLLPSALIHTLVEYIAHAKAANRSDFPAEYHEAIGDHYDRFAATRFATGSGRADFDPGLKQHRPYAPGRLTCRICF